MHSGMNCLPTEAEIQAYENLGHYVTPFPIIPRQLIVDALYGIERYYAGERDWNLPISGGFLDWKPQDKSPLRINDYVSLQCKELNTLCTHSAIAAVAGRLARAEGIRLFHDQLITKMPSESSETAIGWHVDKAYWRTCTSEKLLTAWIPLGDMDELAGGLSVIPGSHRFPRLEWMTTFNDKNLKALESRIEAEGISMKPVAPSVPLGHVSFHSGGTIHGSYPNHGKRSRVAITIHFQDLDNQYKPVLNASGRQILHVNDLLCRRNAHGFPDYSDPEICPTLWRADGSNP